jgi:hypothetical protein
MTSRIYVICPKATLMQHRDYFHERHGAHFIDLPDGRVLAVAHFSGEAGENVFTSDKSVEVLPDPLYESQRELSPEHLAATAHLNPEGKTIFHLAKAAGRVAPMLKLRSWL